MYKQLLIAQSVICCTPACRHCILIQRRSAIQNPQSLYDAPIQFRLDVQYYNLLRTASVTLTVSESCGVGTSLIFLNEFILLFIQNTGPTHIEYSFFSAILFKFTQAKINVFKKCIFTNI